MVARRTKTTRGGVFGALREGSIVEVLADIIKTIPTGKRTARMIAMLEEARKAAALVASSENSS